MPSKYRASSVQAIGVVHEDFATHIISVEFIAFTMNLFAFKAQISVLPFLSKVGHIITVGRFHTPNKYEHLIKVLDICQYKNCVYLPFKSLRQILVRVFVAEILLMEKPDQVLTREQMLFTCIRPGCGRCVMVGQNRTVEHITIVRDVTVIGHILIVGQIRMYPSPSCAPQYRLQTIVVVPPAMMLFRTHCIYPVSYWRCATVTGHPKRRRSISGSYAVGFSYRGRHCCASLGWLQLARVAKYSILEYSSLSPVGAWRGLSGARARDL